MSQTKVDFSQNPTGPQLMDDYLAKMQENVLTTNSGVLRPEYAKEGTFWIDNSITPWLLKVYDGSEDLTLGQIDVNNNKFIPSDIMTTIGDITTKGTDGNPTTIKAGSKDYVLTSNGAGQLPSYQKNPIGIYEYSETRTYALNDIAKVVIENQLKLYLSLIADNVGNAVTDTDSWSEIPLGGLPSQTGQDGKFLTTNGTIASWAVVDVNATIDQRLQVVEALPSNPTEGVFYFIRE